MFLLRYVQIQPVQRINLVGTLEPHDMPVVGSTQILTVNHHELLGLFRCPSLLVSQSANPFRSVDSSSLHGAVEVDGTEVAQKWHHGFAQKGLLGVMSYIYF